MVRRKRKGLCLTTSKVSTYKRSRLEIEVQDIDSSVTDDGLRDNDSIASTTTYFMESNEADENRTRLK